MSYPRSISDEQLARLEEIARQRLAIPSDKRLAFEMGLNIKLIQRWLTYLRRVKLQGSTINSESFPVSDIEIERLRSLG